MNRTAVIFLAAVLGATVAQATTYVRVEKDGTKTYSDRPLAGGHPIDVQPAQTYSAPPASSGDSRRPGEEQSLLDAANFHYQGCTLTPRNDETFTNPESVPVSLMLAPALRYTDRVTFTMDGSTAGPASANTSLLLTQPDRGSHTVTARVTDQEGRSLCEANTTFHVMRPTLNSPTRRPPPPPPPRPTPH